MPRRTQSHRKRSRPIALGGFAAFWAVGLAVWFWTAVLPAQLVLGGAGLALGLALWRYLSVPRSRRRAARRLVSMVLGTSLFGISVWTERNVQIEGLFCGLLTGVVEGAVIHYVIAKVAGPFVFGRIWCGWACWIGALLDLLPYRQAPPRSMRWSWLRLVHFGLSLALVGGLWLGAGYASAGLGPTAVRWFIGGNLGYFVVGVILALVMHDNRAFCAYLCPITVPLTLTSRFALLRVKGDRSRCDDDGACVRVCPMGIRITDYLRANERILSTECILCQECINVCVPGALSLSVGFDLGGKERLRERPAR